MLGIDVAKDTLVCTQVDPTTRKTCWSGQVPNTPAGLAQLLARTPESCPWVLEPTGRYSSLAVRLAQAERRQVLLAPPKRAKAFLASVQDRAKTDRLDSRGLALYALSQPLRPFLLRSEAVEQLQQLLRARKGLAKALTSLELQRKELPHAAPALDPAIASLKEQKKALDAQIAELVSDTQAFPAVAELDRVPGIGPLTAASMAVCLQSKEFAHPDQFVAYLGLDIGVRQSGKRQGQVGLTRQGDAELRRLLFLAAMSNVQVKDSPFRLQYERERAKGLSGTAAACAVARKLAKVCWSLVKHGGKYDAARVQQQPKRAPAASPPAS